MSAPNRIAGAGRLTPAKTINFSFDGTDYEALEGDTVASALLAHDVHLVGRSFKYHRPRGIVAAGSEEPNALINVVRDATRTTPNVRASVQEVYDGLVTQSQNRWPSLKYDIGEINNLGSPFFSAGFYYKTFMWPKKAWDKLYEPAIRSAAGLGVAPKERDTDLYANRFAHCDVLVVGAGPAGLSAALAAAQTGSRVVLCDERARMGGSLHFDVGAEIDGQSGYDWAQRVAGQLSAMDNVTCLPRTTAFGYYAQNMVSLVERMTDHLAEPMVEMPRERLWQVRAGKVILATGAIERHLVFSGNDRPGVMQASAARTFLHHYGVRVGNRVLTVTANDSAYQAAMDLQKAGVEIPAIVDIREGASRVAQSALASGIKVITGGRVKGTKGRLRIKSATIEHGATSSPETFGCDALIMSGGWTPSVHLFSQSRGKLVWDEGQQQFLPGASVQDCVSVGACGGETSLALVVERAGEAGHLAGRGEGQIKAIPASTPTRWSGQQLGEQSESARGKAFVDFQNDVTAKDVRQAVREGMHSIEHIKRFTTTGMATDQGKTSNLHGLAIAADSLDKQIPSVGLTTFRAPFTPVTFGALTGHARGALFDPVRKTAMHSWATDRGAVFEDVGQWKRAWYFPNSGEDMQQAVTRECKTVREVAGVFDASTLGKIEVVGPDAARFLELMYTNPWVKLGVGRLRYGIMLGEDGFIMDDGVVARLAEDRFHVTTTTGGAPRVLHHMEDYLQTEFPHLNVWLTSTTEQWAVIAVQGPRARDILAPLVEDVDISAEAMPHMSGREGRICGVPTRLFRVSFTGELGFEVNVPSGFGPQVMEQIWAQAEPLGACPYGTETMHVLRAEKGYIIVGQDTDGTVTPHDAGVGWAIGKKKTDFVGIRGLMRPDLTAEGRRHLVGLKTRNGVTILEEGAQIVTDPLQSVPMKIDGFVTSSYWSEACGHSIALALVKDGHNRKGQTLYVPMADDTIAVEITDPVFFDPEGDRIHG